MESRLEKMGNWCSRHLIVVMLFAVLVQLHVTFGEEMTKRKITTPSSTGNSTFNGKPCNADSLDSCWSKLPSMNSPQIPTNTKEVETACNAFKIGMDCVDDYTKQCMSKKQSAQLKSTFKGAHEMFSHLCTSGKFRAEFLSHSPCFGRISKKWDECSAHFIKALKKVETKELLAVCCIRLRFLQCVTEVAELHCSKESSIFVNKLAETLVTSTSRNKGECSSVNSSICSQTSGASSPIRTWPFLPSGSARSWVFKICSVPAELVSSVYNLFGHYNRVIFSQVAKIANDWVGQLVVM